MGKAFNRFSVWDAALTAPVQTDFKIGFVGLKACARRDLCAPVARFADFLQTRD